MKRRVVILLIAMMIIASMPVYAFANTSRILVIVPSLSFEGTTANCSLTVTGNNSTDRIEAVIKLWYGDTCLETWSKSGTGYLFFNDTHSVVWNREYTLTADVEINDVPKPTASISKKCE